MATLNRPMTDQERHAAQEISRILNAQVPGLLASLATGRPSSGQAPHVRARSLPNDPGVGRSAQWLTEDGWLIGYSTSRIEGGEWHGKFIVTAHKPIGPGARSGRGKARRWEIAYSRAFATRKAARARAEALYRQHSPKWAAKHPPRDAK